MNKPIQTLSLAALMAIGTSAAHAAPVPSTVSTTPGSDYSVAQLETSATTGATMSGIVVTVTFADATTSSGIWAATSLFDGHAVADGWSLAVNGSTYDNLWHLRNTGTRGTIVGFAIDAAPASVSFDIVASPDLGTPNSDPGRPFGNVDDNLETVTGADALYSNRLFVGGTFYGDMYEMLSVSLAGGLEARGLLLFSADTDNALPGSITPVPEPETYTLMLGGLGVVAWVARRRRA
jgi:hypothetical protein